MKAVARLARAAMAGALVAIVGTGFVTAGVERVDMRVDGLTCPL